MSKVCFVISPMGPPRSPERKRADYVLDTYIQPACERAGYDAVRADGGVGQNIVKGTTTALQNAPMAVAYMGPTPDSMPASPKGNSCWNANVMIEIGYRLASRLPLIFLCDQNSDDDLPELPMNLRALNVIPLPRPEPKNQKWVDTNSRETVESLIKQIQDEEQTRRLLDSMHPLAAINAASSQATTSNNLYYTAASDVADDVFGVAFEDGRAPRLVGRTMEQFLSAVQKRMHPAQWRAFERDQTNARNKLTRRATGDDDEKQAIATVPIVFENHENSSYNHRAFLPIIVQDFRPPEDGLNWYNLRVLYLNVTTATEKVKGPDGEEYYACRLDPTSNYRLEPLKAPDPGIRVFLSYGSENRANVLDVYKRLREMSPVVEPFMDVAISKGDNWVRVLRDTIETFELCFLFLEGDAMGAGQQAEVDVLEARLMARKERDCPVVPVLLRSDPPPRLPAFLTTRQWVKFEDLTDRELRQILWSHFPKRCPGDWGSRPGDWGRRSGDWGSRPGNWGKALAIETPFQPPPVERRPRGED